LTEHFHFAMVSQRATMFSIQQSSVLRYERDSVPPSTASQRKLIAPLCTGAIAHHVGSEKVRRRTVCVSCVSALLLVLLCRSSLTAAQSAPPLSEQIVGQEFAYTLREGDSLASIGARFGVTVEFLAASNNLSPRSHLKIGQPFFVDNRHIVATGLRDGIIVNIPQRMLFYFQEGRLTRHFPVGLGRPDRPTPTGPFKIVSKAENPTWHVPRSIQEEMSRAGQAATNCVPPGPDNPLGKHWLGLSIPRYGIHGTNNPTSVYQFDLYGCVLAHNDDIAQFFDDVPLDTAGILIYRRLLIARSGDRVFLEVHGDIYKKQPSVQKQLQASIKSFNLESIIDRDLAQEVIRKQEGVARDITLPIRSRNSRKNWQGH
jgi:L,D-transpeptidase ErfK/SrfK